jgi:hypothetical protein
MVSWPVFRLKDEWGGMGREFTMMESLFGMKPGRPALLFLALLIVCTIATFTLDGRLAKAVANHLGGLSIVGLLAYLTMYIAYKKGRNQRRAFILGMLLPAILGAVAAWLVYLSTGYLYCGGGVVLLAALVIIVVYACLRKRKHRHPGMATA